MAVREMIRRDQIVFQLLLVAVIPLEHKHSPMRRLQLHKACVEPIDSINLAIIFTGSYYGFDITCHGLDAFK